MTNPMKNRNLPDSLELEKIDKERSQFHNFFRFPGSFHPPLVNMILSKYHNLTQIGDPMSGSGSVALEGIAMGCDVLSMDIDPLSYLITKVKSCPMDPREYEQLFEQWLELTGPLPPKDQTSKAEAKRLLHEVETTTCYSWPPNPFHWFETHVIASLARLLLALHDLGHMKDGFRGALEATFAAVIRRVSRADPQPVSGLEVTKIMKKRLKKGIEFDVIGKLRERSMILAKGYRHLLSLDSIGISRVAQGDVRSDWSDYCRKCNYEPDLIITSPPYCNAIEYWRRHRLEYFWLGLLNREEILRNSRKFIGSTTIFQDDLRDLEKPKLQSIRLVIKKIGAKRKIRKARLLQKYFLDTEKWTSSVLSTLSPNGIACVIVGPSKSYGVDINTPKFVIDIIRMQGYNAEMFLEYSLKNQRMQYPTRNGAKIKTETVIVVSK